MPSVRLQLQRLSLEALKAVRGAATTLLEAGFEEVSIPDLLDAVAACMARKVGKRGAHDAALFTYSSSSSSSLPSDEANEGTRAHRPNKKAGHDIAGEGEAGSASPPRPSGMTQKQDVTKDMKQRQGCKPQKWAMTLGQWLDVLAHCVGTEEYKDMKRRKRMVSMYDINNLFVKPWTETTGCGVAVLMNPKAGHDAELMFSHAWGEDVEESLAAVEGSIRNAPELHRNIKIWFCLFANYQCEDGFGPAIGDQLDLKPFAEVITSTAVKNGHGMCAIHTTKADLYTRLWCVHEVAEAESKGLHVFSAMSPEYVEKITRRMAAFVEHGYDDDYSLLGAGISCRTIMAECSFVSDETSLLETIRQIPGGFRSLDRIVLDFRMRTLPASVRDLAALARLRNNSLTDSQQVHAIQQAANKRVGNVTSLALLEECVIAGGKVWKDSDAVIRAAVQVIANDGDREAARAALLRIHRHETAGFYAHLCINEVLVRVASKGDEEVLTVLRSDLFKSGCASRERHSCSQDDEMNGMNINGHKDIEGQHDQEEDEDEEGDADQHEDAMDNVAAPRFTTWRLWTSASRAIAKLAAQGMEEAMLGDLLSSLDSKHWREKSSLVKAKWAALDVFLSLGAKGNPRVVRLYVGELWQSLSRLDPVGDASGKDLMELLRKVVKWLHGLVRGGSVKASNEEECLNLVMLIAKYLVPRWGEVVLEQGSSMKDMHREACMGLLECLRIPEKQEPERYSMVRAFGYAKGPMFWEAEKQHVGVDIQVLKAIRHLGLQPGHREALHLLLPLAAAPVCGPHLRDQKEDPEAVCQLAFTSILDAITTRESDSGKDAVHRDAPLDVVGELTDFISSSQRFEKLEDAAQCRRDWQRWYEAYRENRPARSFSSEVHLKMQLLFSKGGSSPAV